MATPSVFNLSEFVHAVDGVVVGPSWSGDLCRELLRALRLARPATPGSLSDPSGDLAVVARVYHEVLTLDPDSAQWPIFASGKSRPSLFKSAIRHSVFDDAAIDSLCALDDAEHLLAANVARWLLRLPQQKSAVMVFVALPPSLEPTEAMPRHRSRSASMEVAAVA